MGVAVVVRVLLRRRSRGRRERWTAGYIAHRTAGWCMTTRSGSVRCCAGACVITTASSRLVSSVSSLLLTLKLFRPGKTWQYRVVGSTGRPTARSRHEGGGEDGGCVSYSASLTVFSKSCTANSCCRMAVTSTT